VVAYKADINLLFSSDIVGDRRATIDKGDISASKVLSGVVRGTNLAFVSFGNRIVVVESSLYKKNGKSSDSVDKRNNSLQHNVSGVVSDQETGRSLPGVNILVKNMGTGTATKSDGSYKLEVSSPKDTLVFSFVGYNKKEVPIRGREEVNVSLAPAVSALQEVVVNVGYQEQTVATTTGSVDQISGDDLETESTSNLTEALQGRVPGLIGVSQGGRPGIDGSRLLIRGRGTLNDNSPLVVIDGVPDRQGGLSRLSPSDIADVSVLQGASAAIYGAQAANGVILVQTKRGREESPQINVNVDQSWNQPTVLPELANASSYMEMLNELDLYRGNEPRFSQDEIEKHRNCQPDSWTCFDTDWFEESFQDFSSRTTANASLTGGEESYQYRFSLRGLTESGITTSSSTRYNQVGFRTVLDWQPSDFFSISANVHGRVEDRNYPTESASQIFQFAQQLKPTDPAYWPNGKPAPGLEDGINPVVAASEETGYDDRETYFLQSNLSLNFDLPVEDWNAEGTVAYDRNFMDRQLWKTPWTLYNWSGQRDEDGDPILAPQEVGVPEPRLSEWKENERDILLRATSQYEKSVGDHNAKLLVGTEYQSGESKNVFAFRRFFQTDQIDQLSAGGTSQQDIAGNASHSARLNFFGRANYNFKERYLLEVVARYDGSYIFPEGDRFGFFPTVSAGWRIAQEGWFDSFTGGFFDRLKLRASYGQTGNDSVEPYQFLRTFGFSGQWVTREGLDPIISVNRVPNPNITWEVATQFDAGLQGAVLEDRLTFDFSYFNYFRDDILWFRNESVPQTAGFSLPRENIGQVRSWGVDGQLNYQQDITSNISIRAGGNLSWARDKIVFFDEAPGAPSYQRGTGKPINSQLYFVADGIWNTQKEIDNADAHWPGARPGDIRFKDINGDGKIDGKDRKRVGTNRRPDLSGAFHLGTTVSQFDARVMFQWATNVNRYVGNNFAGEIGNYLQKHVENRWTPENKDGTWPRAYNRTDPYWIGNQNTFWLRDSSYLRLKSVRVGYTVSSEFSEQFGVDKLSVHISGRNLLTLSALDLYDPEIDWLSSYPPERSFTIGASVDF